MCDLSYDLENNNSMVVSLAKVVAVIAALLLQTWLHLSLIQSVGMAVIVCALANLFYEQVGWLLIPHGPNPFASDTRVPRKSYELDQRERDSVLKQSFKISKAGFFFGHLARNPRTYNVPTRLG